MLFFSKYKILAIGYLRPRYLCLWYRYKCNSFGNRNRNVKRMQPSM